MYKNYLKQPKGLFVCEVFVYFSFYIDNEFIKFFTSLCFFINFVVLTIKAMKNTGLLLFLIFSMSVMKSQDLKTYESLVDVGGDHIISDDLTATSLAVQLTFLPEKRFSFHYGIGIGVTQRNKFYAHIPAFTYWGASFLGEVSDEDGSWLGGFGILLMLIPEAVSVNFNLSDKVKLSPFIKLNSMEIYKHADGNYRQKPSLSSGVKLSYRIANRYGGFVYTAANLVASNGWGFQAGTGVRFYF